MITPVEEEEKVLRLVKSVSRNARRVYSLAGTQKFELPTDEVGWGGVGWEKDVGVRRGSRRRSVASLGLLLEPFWNFLGERGLTVLVGDGVQVDISDVFVVVERAQEDLHIRAWGISNTTLEDVFIKIATRGKEVALS